MSDEKQGVSTWNVIVGVATVIGAIAFLVKIFGKSESEQKEADAKKSRKKTYKALTYEDYQYKDWADILVQALLPDLTEDEEAVYDVFRDQKTVGDINKLIEYFDTQRQLFTLNYISLPVAIATYLSKGEKEKLNGIIHDNGINYTFK